MSCVRPGVFLRGSDKLFWLVNALAYWFSPGYLNALQTRLQSLYLLDGTNIGSALRKKMRFMIIQFNFRHNCSFHQLTPSISQIENCWNYERTQLCMTKPLNIFCIMNLKRINIAGQKWEAVYPINQGACSYMRLSVIVFVLFIIEDQLLILINLLISILFFVTLLNEHADYSYPLVYRVFLDKRFKSKITFPSYLWQSTFTWKLTALSATPIYKTQ